jgi:hypothetical protein
MRILDLFSGTHSVAIAARPLGHEVVTLDSILPAGGPEILAFPALLNCARACLD